MPDCSACGLFALESKNTHCLHVNRPGGLEITRSALRQCNLPPGSRVADIASGLGATLACLKDEYQLEPVGVDLSGEMLRNAKKLHLGVDLSQADCAQLPFPTHSLDAIVMECALSLSGDIVAAMDEFRRVLRPDGFLILSDIYIRELRTPDAMQALKSTHCLSGAVTKGQLFNHLQSGGFTVKVWEDQTPHLKQWMARMVFELGSLQEFYRSLVTCDEDACQLETVLGKQLKLGYYLAIAGKMN